MVPPLVQPHAVTATLLRRWGHMNRNWGLEGLDRFIWNMECFPLPLIRPDVWLARLWQNVCTFTTLKENHQKVQTISSTKGRGPELAPERKRSILDSYATNTRIFLSLRSYDVLDILCQAINDWNFLSHVVVGPFPVCIYDGYPFYDVILLVWYVVFFHVG